MIMFAPDGKNVQQVFPESKTFNFMLAAMKVGRLGDTVTKLYLKETQDQKMKDVHASYWSLKYVVNIL